MRETVCVHVGQCGNQIGNQFWNQLLHEHEKTPDGDDALSAFFRYAPQGRDGRTYAMKARALLIDMECGVLSETMKSSLGPLFEETQLVYDVSGSGNNYAHGHFQYGPQYRDRFEEGLRRNAEQCDSLQTYVVTHSLGGGTGSGVGTYVLGMLDELYPKVCRFSTCVYPSAQDNVVTAPYNVILSTSELIEHADCVFPLDNSALFAFSQREQPPGDGTEGRNTSGVSTPKSNTPNSGNRGFDAINTVAARMLCHLTSSSRFHGEMNVDLNEIYTNLVPYPRLHFLTTSLSVRAPKSQKSTTTGRRLNSMVHGKSTASSGIASSSSSSSSSSRHGARAALQRAFGDVLGERGQLAAARPMAPVDLTAAGMTTTTTHDLHAATQCLTLSSAFLARGRPESVPLTDFIDCVNTAQRSLRFPHWNQNACKIGMCGTPSPGDDMSVLAVYNSTSFASVVSREMSGFQRLFRKKAMLHHYTQFVDASVVAQAERTTDTLLEEYKMLEQQGSIAARRRISNTGANTTGTRTRGTNSSGEEDSRHRNFENTSASNSSNAMRPRQLFPAF